LFTERQPKNTLLLVTGLVLVGVYLAEMAVITPVKLARADRARLVEVRSSADAEDR